MQNKIYRIINLIAIPLGITFIYKFGSFVYEDGGVLSKDNMKGLTIYFILFLSMAGVWKEYDKKWGKILAKWLEPIGVIGAIILFFMWRYVLEK